MEGFLRLYCNWAQDDWALWLPLAEFAGNNAISSTTGVSPFFANYGFNPRMGIEPQAPPRPDLAEAQRKEYFKANEIANRFREIIDQVRVLSKIAQDRYEKNANSHRSDAPKYKVGDEVMVRTENWHLGQPMKKLGPKWEGPFVVTKASTHAVTVKLPSNIKIFPTFHVGDVRPRSKERAPGQQDEDLYVNEGRVVVRTDDHHDTVEWKFDKVLDYRQGENGRWVYLVQWANGQEDWQPAGNLKGCDDILWAFHDAHPELPPPRPWLQRRRGG